MGVHNLTQVVADDKPPSRESIYGLDQTLDKDEVDALYAEALREYQHENTKLFYLFAPSV